MQRVYTVYIFGYIRDKEFSTPVDLNFDPHLANASDDNDEEF